MTINKTAIESNANALSVAVPEIPLHDTAFKYTASYATDLRATFKRFGFKEPNRKKQRQMKLALNS